MEVSASWATTIAVDLQRLIADMAVANRTWGENG